MPGNLACLERSRRDPQIGRFLGVDPLADGEGQEIYSPYAAMGNMPESMVDPNGLYFTFSSSTLEAVFNNLRAESNKKMAAYIEELATMNLLSDDVDVQRVGVLNSLISIHRSFNAQLDEMAGNTEVEFHLSNNAPSGTNVAETFWNASEKRIQLNFGGNNPWMPTLAHELRHGYGYINGEMVVSAYSPNEFYDMMDEVKANLTGYLFTSTPNKAVDGSYGVEDFRVATKPGGNYTQLAGKEEQLSIHTPISVFQKYTQNTLISSFPGLAENPNATVGDAITNINSRSKNSLKYLWGNLLKK